MAIGLAFARKFCLVSVPVLYPGVICFVPSNVEADCATSQAGVWEEGWC